MKRFGLLAASVAIALVAAGCSSEPPKAKTSGESAKPKSRLETAVTTESTRATRAEPISAVKKEPTTGVKKPAYPALPPLPPDEDNASTGKKAPTGEKKSGDAKKPGDQKTDVTTEAQKK